MKRTVWLWELFGFAVTSLGGTLLHFAYEWLDGAGWIAPFSGVNESTFEHMKLFFWSTFIYTLRQSVPFRSYGDFWCVKLRGMLLGIAAIPVLFYTYNGVIGKSPDFINISIFFFAAAITYVYEARSLGHGRISCKSPTAALCVHFLLGAMFVLFTFFPPHLELFRDPNTNSFGIFS